MEFLGQIGFSFSALAYLVFCFLLFAARNNIILAKWMLFSAVISAASYFIALLQIKLGFSLQWVLLIDSLRIASWSILVLICNTESTSVRKLLANYHIKQYLSIYVVLMASCWGLSYFFDYSYEYIFLLFISLNLWSLVLLEQLYRSADDHVRWAIWPMVIGLACVAVFDFVIFAQATMVGKLDFDFWYSRGFLALLATPFLLVSTRRIKNGAVRIFVSRHVVFYSSMLMIAGLYLLVMAFAGYVINYIGGEWGRLVSVAFLVLSSVVLLVLLMTEKLRRQVKVFIAKNFFANRYEYRDEWLKLIEKIEETPSDNHYQLACEIMMSKLGANSAAIVKQKSPLHYDIMYNQGMNLTEAFDLQLNFVCQFCHNKGWIIDIDEYQNAPSMYPELTLDVDLCRSFHVKIIIPIYIGKAFYGLFILGDTAEKIQLNWEDRDLLFAVSKQLGNFISLNEANDALAESKQFDAFNRMSAFLVHDLKNVQAQLALITTNAKRHRNNPEFVDDVFETIESATERLAKVLSQLRDKQMIQSKSTEVDVSQLINQVVQQRNVQLPQVQFEAIDDCFIVIDGETFHSILNHLLQNAQEATNNDGWVKVGLSYTSHAIFIDIEDNGCGMSAEFVEKRLFKPFDTTKGNAGMGIGVYEAKQFVEGLNGSIDVHSEAGKGTRFRIQLPINS